MKISILAFGIAREICGARQFEFEAPDGCSTSQLKSLLIEAFPAFHQLANLAIAVNETYAQEDLTISPNDEIALIPPVSGG